MIVSNEQAYGHVIADSVQFMPDLEDSAKKDSAKKQPQAESKSSDKNVDQQHESMIKQIAILEKLQTEIQKELDLRPMAQTLRPADSPSDIPIHVRGSVHRLGPVVERGFLSCINSHEPELNRRIRVQAADNGRLELAQWTIAPENPLTARVYVNRIWYHMMGRGIWYNRFAPLGTQTLGLSSIGIHRPRLVQQMARPDDRYLQGLPPKHSG